MAKSSRKGKKAWRKNIDTADVERAVEEHTRAERLGTDVGDLPDSQLFFIDKEKEAAAAAPRRKAQRARGPKLLRSQAILNASHAARPVIKPPVARTGRQAGAAAGKQLAAKPAGGVQHATTSDSGRGNNGRVYDLWAAEAPDLVRREAEADFDELAQALAAGTRTAFGIVRPSKRRKGDAPSRIAAVEVDAPGCSYNPDAAQHEETIARAVAEENTKILDAEMRAKPPPKRVDWEPETDPLLQHQVDADWDEDGAEDEEDAEEGGAEGAAGAGKRQREKKTRAQRNRQGRAKEAAAELAARRSLKRQRRQLDALPDIQAEVAAMEVEREKRKLRRAAVSAEKAASQPPRLGKLKFAPQPVQVLLSEDINGSLRKIKGVPMLAKDRYIALQKRGAIEPRMPAGLQKRRRRKVTMSGQRGEAARAGHEELTARLRKAAL